MTKPRWWAGPSYHLLALLFMVLFFVNLVTHNDDQADRCLGFALLFQIAGYTSSLAARPEPQGETSNE